MNREITMISTPITMPMPKCNYLFNWKDQFFKTQKIRAESKEYTFPNYQKTLNDFHNVFNEEK